MFPLAKPNTLLAILLAIGISAVQAATLPPKLMDGVDVPAPSKGL
jgi:hypothetical protein